MAFLLDTHRPLHIVSNFLFLIPPPLVRSKSNPLGRNQVSIAHHLPSSHGHRPERRPILSQGISTCLRLALQPLPRLPWWWFPLSLVELPEWMGVHKYLPWLVLINSILTCGSSIRHRCETGYVICQQSLSNLCIVPTMNLINSGRVPIDSLLRQPQMGSKAA